MKLSVLFKTARCAVIEIDDGIIYEGEREYRILVNGKEYGASRRAVSSVYGLKPDTEYEITAEGRDGACTVTVKTDYEFVTLNVRDFGARGDGSQDDTIFIQSAIMACPKDSRVLIPEGVYRVTSLYLKDDVRLELARGAVLSAYTERERFPILKGLVESYDEKSEYNLGTWE